MSQIYNKLKEIEEERKVKKEQLIATLRESNSAGSYGESVQTKQPENVTSLHRVAETAVIPAKDSRLLTLFFIVIILVLLGINIAIFMRMNKYAAGKDGLLSQLKKIEMLFVESEQKVNALSSEARTNKADFDRVTRSLNDISGKLAAIERQSNANTADTNALSREKTRMADKIAKIESALVAMETRLEKASAAMAEVK